jgi:BlaI family penicillinase repressor
MSTTPKLGKVQLQIMQVLWQRGSATAREITDDLNQLEGAKPIAHSTVQTLLRKLEAKGSVTHHIEDRVFIFAPVQERSEVTNGAVSDLLARLFDRSISGLVAHLVKQEKISPEEMERLRQIIDEAGESPSHKTDDK